jgi:molybdopterin/thiamine biosynthesis adenylyltransferase
MNTLLHIKKKDRYSRLQAIDWWQQEKISRARVLVAGAGALGNEVLKNLALLGVGHILIVDFDWIDVTNLSRAVLFRPGDEGEPKAQVAARRVHEINPDINIEALVGDAVWDIGLGMLSRFDVVVGCLDNREARLGINRNCWKTGIPWVDGAIDILSGQIRVYIPPDSACYECSFTAQDYQDLNLRYSCQLLAVENSLDAKISTTPTSASIVAAIQVQEVLKLIHHMDVEAGVEYEFNGQNHTYRKTRIKRNEDCLSHDTYPLDEVITLPEARAERTTASQILAFAHERMVSKTELILDREIITRFICPHGHESSSEVHLLQQTREAEIRCPTCGAPRTIHTTYRIGEYDEKLANLPLKKLGVPAGHILTVGHSENKMFFELGGDLLFGKKIYECERRTKNGKLEPS